MEIVYKCTNTRSCHRDNKRLSEPKDGFIDMCGSFGECQHKEKMLLIKFEELSSLKQENERLKNNIEERKHAQFKQQAYTAQLQQQNKELVDFVKEIMDCNDPESGEVMREFSKMAKEIYDRSVKSEEEAHRSDC